MSNVLPVDDYRQQSCFTDPGEFAALFDALPDDLADLCRIVRGVYVHYRSDALPPVVQPRMVEVDTRYVAQILDRIMQLDDRGLTEVRPVEQRFIGCCRDASSLLCAMLRHKGIPARIRVGFATYIQTDDLFPYADHVVTEYWDAADGRWKLVDAEQDETLRTRNRIPFDVQDIPRDRFLTGGRAWQMGREDARRWDHFGVNDDVKGRWFVAGYLMRDLAALNHHEVLLWDTWGLMNAGDDLSDSDLALLDHVAALTQAGDDAFDTIRSLYETDARLTLPVVVIMYSPVSEWREERLNCR